MSSCSCVDVHVDVPAITLRITNPRARKLHTCCECGEPIRPGETYLCEDVRDGGRFECFKTCADCQSIRGAFFCGSWYWASIWEDLREHIRNINGDVSSECLVPLTPTARRKVCNIIHEVWNEL